MREAHGNVHSTGHGGGARRNEVVILGEEGHPPSKQPRCGRGWQTFAWRETPTGEMAQQRWTPQMNPWVAGRAFLRDVHGDATSTHVDTMTMTVAHDPRLGLTKRPTPRRPSTWKKFMRKCNAFRT